ncbi:MAG: glycosyltransferase [Parcubacteria group bacterium Gr01-1014_29]|nr:MAG: glycosyltransferase [Parcubacteria group bacterium Gr01-1014_29]
MLLNTKPTISIVLPTYNRAYIMGRAIESVRTQTHSDWELIVVDDGSTDNTREVVASFQDPRIQYIKHKTNQGLAASRNSGIRASCGAYIANLDSDDVWLPHMLEHTLAAFQNAPTNVLVVYSMCERKLADGRVALLPEVDGPRNGDLHNLFLTVNVIGMPFALVKKELFEKAGWFDESIPALQDWEFWIRASQHTHFKFIPEILMKSYVLEDSIANNKSKRLRGRELIFQKHEHLFQTLPDVYARHAFTIGHTYSLNGDLAPAISYLGKAWRAHPSTIKYFNAYVLAIVSRLLHAPQLYRRIATR